MNMNDSTEIFKQTEDLMKEAIHQVQEVINNAEEDAFKMILIDSCETYKERLEMLVKASQSFKENNALPPSESSKNELTSKQPSETDQQIAHMLFDQCNTQVKEVFTFLNHYKNIDKKVKEEIKDAVKAIERLRQDLAAYL